jgi:hypothetical protein
MNAGNALQGYDQASLIDQQTTYENNRDFEMQQRMGYQQGMLGQAPNSVGAIAANKVDPYTATMGGATAGFGFNQKYGDQLFGMGTGSNRYSGSGMPPSRSSGFGG